jgi:hypothetical protein
MRRFESLDACTVSTTAEHSLRRWSFRKS